MPVPDGRGIVLALLPAGAWGGNCPEGSVGL